MKAELVRLIPRKNGENLELLIAHSFSSFPFLSRLDLCHSIKSYLI